ncbi:sulfite exporter TauE/SafE family protein [Planotetraspora sp. A-T 1434]|uniref:sulfite exporter TauE/SafE family protein n=1 Tax=Planotetraspora sp. A-T 1434 TaxID=2979219 RepID=UPI0021BE82C2|nr:sulfite exporter TauE/SafE family protein [Planotetraspora sp. A-T 1434]MCT9934253.1 sulfite exporter TauE/SafE family protein [Planotetraspora sp. A-T 1434]
MIADVLGLAGVGVLAGVVSTVVSLASVISYPALLAFGLPPLSANVTNTVALLFTGMGAAAGSRPELAGQGRLLLRVGWVTALGGAAGAALLLVTPSRTFELIAPWLIGAASLLLLRPPRTGHVSLGGRDGWTLRAALFGVAVYVGYFGAAGGIIMFAVLASALDQHPARVNAVKNVVSALANGVAAVGFALFGPVQWSAAAPLAAGFLVGGWLGPALARRLPGQTLRIAAAVCGLAVAVKLGFDAYRGAA